MGSGNVTCIEKPRIRAFERYQNHPYRPGTECDQAHRNLHLGHPAEVTLSRTQLPSAAPLRVTSAASQLGWAEPAGLWLSCIQLSLVLGSAKPSPAQLGNSWLS